jgi:hypothetical protein
LIHSTQRPIPVVEIDVVQNELFVVAMVGDRGLNHCIVIRDPSSKLLSRRFFWQQNGFHGHATALMACSGIALLELSAGFGLFAAVAVAAWHCPLTSRMDNGSVIHFLMIVCTWSLFRGEHGRNSRNAVG